MLQPNDLVTRAEEPRFWYRCAGLTIVSSISLDGLTEAATPGRPDVIIEWASEASTDAFAADTTHMFSLGEEGAPWMEVRRGVDGFLARWPGQLEVIIPDDGARLMVCQRGDVEDSIARLILCQALSFALAAHGRESMHASAVEIGGRAVIFSGDSGRGKSTLATALCQMGGRLLSDDMLSIRLDDANVPMVDPTATRTWLADELATLVAGEGAGVAMDRAHKVSVGGLEPAQGPAPLGAVYLLRYRLGEASISEPLPGREALTAFLGALFNNVVRTPERLETQFNVATAIAALVPIRVLRWEPGPDAVRGVAAQIMADLTGEAAPLHLVGAPVAQAPTGTQRVHAPALHIAKPEVTKERTEAEERHRLIEALRAVGVADLPDDTYGEPLLRTAQVAALLRCSDRTIRTWSDLGKLPYIKTLGGRRMFPAQGVMTVLQTMRGQRAEA